MRAGEGKDSSRDKPRPFSSTLIPRHSRLWNTAQSTRALTRWECTHEPMRAAGIVNCHKAYSNLLIWGWTDWLNGSSTFSWTSVPMYPWSYHLWYEKAVVIAVGLHEWYGGNDMSWWSKLVMLLCTPHVLVPSIQYHALKRWASSHEVWYIHVLWGTRNLHTMHHIKPHVLDPLACR